jgi:DNA-binding NarL/FixJ family response regulator
VPTTVLIVDDHPSFRASVRMLLECEGYTVVGEARDGATALARAAALRPDLVLLDVGLPDVDGFTVAARMTSGGDGPAVVLTSTRDAADYGSVVRRCGACGFLPKGALSGPALAALLP